jgi:hypothetical protein
MMRARNLLTTLLSLGTVAGCLLPESRVTLKSTNASIEAAAVADEDAGLDRDAGPTDGGTGGDGSDSGSPAPEPAAMRPQPAIASQRWSKPVQVSDGLSGNVSHPLLLVDADGNLTGIWGQNGGGRVSRRLTGSTWGASTLIDSRGGEALSARAVAIHPASGDLSAVWRGSNDKSIGNEIFVMRASRYIHSVSSWTSAVDIGDVDGYGADPQVVVSDNGDVFAVWSLSLGAQVSRLPPNGNREPPVVLRSPSGVPGEYARIAADGHGNALAVWHDYVDLDADAEAAVWCRRYSAGSGWGEPLQLAKEGNDAEVTFDRNGDAVVVWVHNTSYVWIKHYDARSDRWNSAVRIDYPESAPSEFGVDGYPTAKFDSIGNVHIAWGNDSGVWVSNFQSASQSATPAKLLMATEKKFFYEPLNLAVDQQERAVLVWNASKLDAPDAENPGWSSSYDPSLGWSAPIQFAPLADDQSVAFGPDGHALLLWTWDETVSFSRLQ